MADTRYGKNILRQTKPGPAGLAATPVALEGVNDWAGIHHRMSWHHIVRPTVLEVEPHSHDFDEFFCFATCDPANPIDFGAEVEVTMGKEAEKHIIDHSSIVCVPKGVVHGPINFKKVTRPVLFCDIYMATEHKAKPAK